MKEQVQSENGVDHHFPENERSIVVARIRVHREAPNVIEVAPSIAHQDEVIPVAEAGGVTPAHLVHIVDQDTAVVGHARDQNHPDRDLDRGL